jgi:hypothetical protein
MTREEDRVMCTGCGNQWTARELAEARAADPVLISCCPDRRPLTFEQWSDRVRGFDSLLLAAGDVTRAFATEGEGNSRSRLRARTDALKALRAAYAKAGGRRL